MFFGHGPIDGTQFGASLIEGDTGSETPKELGHTMEAVGDHRRGSMMRAGGDVGDDFGVLRIGDGRFEDADDSGGPIAKQTAIEANGLTDDARISLESGGPETIGEDDDT